MQREDNEPETNELTIFPIAFAVAQMVNPGLDKRSLVYLSYVLYIK